MVRDKYDLGIVVSWRRRESGRWSSGPAGRRRWTGRLRPGGRGRGPRPAGKRAVRGGHRPRPTSGTAAKRKFRPGGCSRPWRPVVLRQRPRSHRGRALADPECSGAAGRRGDRWSRRPPVKLVIIRYYHGFNLPLNRGDSSLGESTSPAHLGGPVGRIIPVDRSFLPAGWAVLTQLEVVSDPLSRCWPGYGGVCWQGRRLPGSGRRGKLC